MGITGGGAGSGGGGGGTYLSYIVSEKLLER